MFSKKFNPDVIKQYKNIEKHRDKIGYKVKNIPYKHILNENLINIKDSKDLQINIKEDNKDIDNKFKDILSDRSVKENIKLNKRNIEDIKKNFQLECNLENESTNDFIDVKSDFKSEFELQEKNIKIQREKYNSIIDSLLEDGILD